MSMAKVAAMNGTADVDVMNDGEVEGIADGLGEG